MDKGHTLNLIYACLDFIHILDMGLGIQGQGYDDVSCPYVIDLLCVLCVVVDRCLSIKLIVNTYGYDMTRVLTAGLWVKTLTNRKE
jgi:hypothetical protein